MNLHKTMTGLAAAVALTAIAGATQANNVIASTVETSGLTTDFTFTGGVGGTLVSNGPLAVTASGPSGGSQPGFITFGPITETSAVSTGPGTLMSATFSGGGFTISTTDSTGDLLRGTFASSLVSTPNGSTASILNLALNNVTFTSGTFLTQFNALYGGTGAVGNLAVNLSAINPTLAATGTGGGFSAFSAQGSTSTFDAAPAAAVPEPTSVASFGFGGLGLLGLLVRARKVRKTVA